MKIDDFYLGYAEHEQCANLLALRVEGRRVLRARHDHNCHVMATIEEVPVGTVLPFQGTTFAGQTEGDVNQTKATRLAEGCRIVFEWIENYASGVNATWLLLESDKPIRAKSKQEYDALGQRVPDCLVVRPPQPPPIDCKRYTTPVI